MSGFIEIPSRFLAQIARGGDRIPTLYYSGNFMVRRVFWQRLYLLTGFINRHARRRDNCLDFGGGAGVMLPTLSKLFGKVTLLDLQVDEALQVVRHYGLENVTILQQDAARFEPPDGGFDAIVAADVLEHFRDLRMPVEALHRLLANDGVLFTSLPTENWVYVLLRKLFGITKPHDHYHTGYEVEQFLLGNGFEKIAGKCAPLHFCIAPLFLVSCWRKRA